MSGGAERGYKVLLLLGVSAAAVVAVQCAIRWSLKSSDSKASIEKKEEKDKTTILEKTKLNNTSEYPDSESEKLKKSDSKMSAPLSFSAKVTESVQETKKYFPEARDKTQIKSGKHSWSELMEDEDKSQVEISAQMEENIVINDTTQPLKEDIRAHHDSGIVSPQNDINSSPQLQLPTELCSSIKENEALSSNDAGLEIESKCNAGIEKNPIRIKNDEERLDVDGGLGSSVCGEELINAASLANGTVPNQHGAANCDQVPITSNEPTNNELIKTQMKTQRQATGGSDSGQGSEADDGVRMAYHFYIPNHLCGKLIGRSGDTVKLFKNETKCSIQLHERNDSLQGRYKNNQRYRNRDKKQHSEIEPFELQVCMIEGTRNGIDRCLELVREKFPLNQHQDLTLEQINLPHTSSSSGSIILSTQIDSNGNIDDPILNAQQENDINNSSITTPTQLGLDQGAMHEVYVSAIVSGGHVFLQQPNHPTYFALSRLETCMCNVYTRLAVPDVPKEVLEPGLVCVAKWNQQWYRVQVVNYDPSSDNCNVRFLDYGGYYTFTTSDLKQIRSDFLALPFQALEVYLGNVIPPDQKDWPVESALVLEELVSNQIISGRMLGVTEEFIPIVHLYGWVSVDSQDTSDNQQNQQPRLLNRELVDRGVALWTEHMIAPT